MAQDPEVLIAIDENADVQAVVRALRAASLEVDSVLEEVRTVTVRAPAGKLSEIRRVPGVASAEMSREIRIPPPDSEVQ